MCNNVSAFISELIRGANQIESLRDFQKRRMLEMAVMIIRDMREAIAAPASPNARDVVIDLQAVTALIEHGHIENEKVKAAFLKAAAVLRALKIILDTQDEVIEGTTR